MINIKLFNIQMEFSKMACFVRHSLKVLSHRLLHLLIIYFNLLNWLLESLFHGDSYPKFIRHPMTLSFFWKTRFKNQLDAYKYKNVHFKGFITCIYFRNIYYKEKARKGHRREQYLNNSSLHFQMNFAFTTSYLIKIIQCIYQNWN